jgi:hypothetical protein
LSITPATVMAALQLLYSKVLFNEEFQGSDPRVSDSAAAILLLWRAASAAAAAAAAAAGGCDADEWPQQLQRCKASVRAPIEQHLRSPGRLQCRISGQEAPTRSAARWRAASWGSSPWTP